MRFSKIILLFVSIVLSLSLSACVRGRSAYSQQAWPGAFEKGTTQKEVEKKLGLPMGFHRRQVSPLNLREVWVYHFRDRNLAGKHLYPKTHMIVFNNGKLVAHDPDDPYASQFSVKKLPMK